MNYKRITIQNFRNIGSEKTFKKNMMYYRQSMETLPL